MQGTHVTHHSALALSPVANLLHPRPATSRHPEQPPDTDPRHKDTNVWACVSLKHTDTPPSKHQQLFLESCLSGQWSNFCLSRLVGNSLSLGPGILVAPGSASAAGPFRWPELRGKLFFKCKTHHSQPGVLHPNSRSARPGAQGPEAPEEGSLTS